MPVSSPSYFPPERGNGSIVGITAGASTLSARSFLGGNGAGNYTQTGVDDLIVLGYHAFDAGTSVAPITDVDLSGTVVVGNNAASALTVASNSLDPNTDRPDVILGFNAALLAPNIGASIIVGAAAFSAFTGTAGDANKRVAANVIIGCDAVRNMNGTAGLGQAPVDNVIIGYRTLFGINASVGAETYMRRAVVIGSEAADQLSSGVNSAQMYENVVIGYRAARFQSTNSTFGIENVIIGSQCLGAGGNHQHGVVIGAAISGATANSNGVELNNVIIGYAIAPSGGDDNVMVGANINGSTGNRNILIGARAGDNEVAHAFSAKLIVEATDSVTPVSMFWGDMATGNLLIGKSITALTTREFDGAASRNIVKLINGTVGALAPVGGGYFYVAAGALHWVGSAGTDTVVAPA